MAAPDIEDGQAWWRKAESDLAAARILLESNHADTAVYLCQQAAEKALKALLANRGVPFEKTHDLTRLLAEAIPADAVVGEIRGAARRLTPFATLYRYPGELGRAGRRRGATGATGRRARARRRA